MVERRREKVRDREMQGRNLTIYQDTSTSHSFFLTPKRNVLNSYPKTRLRLEERSCAGRSYAGQVRVLTHPRYAASRQAACLAWGGGQARETGVILERRALPWQSLLLQSALTQEMSFLLPCRRLRCKLLVKL